jgi:hypothetical protein
LLLPHWFEGVKLGAAAGAHTPLNPALSSSRQDQTVSLARADPATNAVSTSATTIAAKITFPRFRNGITSART